MPVLLPLLVALGPTPQIQNRVAATRPLSIVEPVSGDLLRGKVGITASEAALADSVTFEWSSNGSTWSPIDVDARPADGFSAVWDTGGYTGHALVRATDSLGNQTHVRVTVDNKAPAAGVAAGRPSFSPNGDGRADRVAFVFRANEAVDLTLQLVGPRGLVVQTIAAAEPVAARRSLRFVWDGTIYDGARRGRDGLYTARAIATDRAGNRTIATGTVDLDTRAPRITRLTASQPNAGRVVVRFSAQDAVPSVTVGLRLLDEYGTTVAQLPAHAVPRGASTLALPVPAILEPGAYRAAVAAWDDAGNDTTPLPTSAPFLFTRAVRAQVWGKFAGVGRSVALTFDDCYDPAGWSGVLDVLAREQVKATFFCTGRAVLANPALGLRTVREGHVVGSHGWDHADFSKLSFGSSLERLLDDRNVWWNLAKVVPMPFFRPPYGAYTPTTISAAGAAGYSAVVLWDVDPFDWKDPGVAAIVSRVVGATTPGAIDLMHTLPQTAAALPSIIDDLRARGYRFLTLPEMAALGTPTPGHWTAY